MICNDINTARTRLRNLSSADADEPYLSWLRDAEIMKFLSVSPDLVNEQYLLDFIAQNNDNPENALFGIFETKTDTHIGNIRLVDINRRLRRASLGIIIGNRDYWGRGLAAESIKALTAFAQSTLGLKRIFAGCHTDNAGSIKAFLKAGFQRSEDIAQHDMDEDNWAAGVVIDHVMMVHINEPIKTEKT